MVSFFINNDVEVEEGESITFPAHDVFVCDDEDKGGVENPHDVETSMNILVMMISSMMINLLQ